MVNGPIAGLVLERASWRILFIVEGIFPIVWAAVWLWGIAASPQTARWLSPPAIGWLSALPLALLSDVQA